jgi:hypothetical protein
LELDNISGYEEVNMKIRVITRFPLPNFIFCHGKYGSSLFHFWFLVEISEIVLIKHNKMHTQVCVPILNFLALIDNLNLRNVKKGRFIIANFYARIPNGEHDV